jgi:hypothetical protein
MRFPTALPLLVVLALACAPAPASSAKRLKSFTFCGPEQCWATPASMVDGDVFDVGHATTPPAIPVRYYRVQLQYAPTGRANVLFIPSLGILRSDDGWWKVPRSTAVALRRVTRLLRAFGPRQF